MPSLAAGLLADRYKVWRLILVTHILLLSGQVSFYMVIPVEDHVYTKESPAPLKMPIIWIIVYYFGAAAISLSTAFMNKSI